MGSTWSGNRLNIAYDDYCTKQLGRFRVSLTGAVAAASGFDTELDLLRRIASACFPTGAIS
jgi:hypothetical protein